MSKSFLNVYQQLNAYLETNIFRVRAYSDQGTYYGEEEQTPKHTSSFF